MTGKRQEGLGNELFGTRLGEARDVAGPVKGEFVPPPDLPDVDERADALPEQEEFWCAPVGMSLINFQGFENNNLNTRFGWLR